MQKADIRSQMSKSKIKMRKSDVSVANGSLARNDNLILN